MRLQTIGTFEEAMATWKGEQYKKKFNIELTQEQIDILRSVADDTNIDLAKALQKALKLTIDELAESVP
jgi:hypothetical protein